MTPATPAPYLSREDMLKIEGPAIVLTDEYFSWVGCVIRTIQSRHHKTGYYNHCMILRKPGVVASQNWTLHWGKLSDYLKGRHRVKVWGWRNLDPAKRFLLERRIDEDVAEGGRYDWLGILGVWFGMRWLNCPGRSYCSEHVAATMRTVDFCMKLEHPTSSELDAWLKTRHLSYVCLGVFDPYRD